jgi:hypothetical protein
VAWVITIPSRVSAAFTISAMDEGVVREHADAYCAALLAGDIERAAEELSNELRANLGQMVAMLPMPLTSASVESLERTASGFRAVVHLIGESSETRLETRWKEREDRPVIVEVSHLTEAGVTPAEVETAPEE